MPRQKKKDKPEKKAVQPEPAGKTRWVLSAGIAAVTLFVYFHSLTNGFVNLDDETYIIHQELIRHFNLKELFTQYVMGNYHPFVMTVYAIIYHFFELNPFPYHLVSLLFHIANSCLVFWLVFYLSKSLNVASVTGLLFAIHPLHVESVAWVSELKDLMYSFGFLFSLIFYVRYLKEKQATRLYIFSFFFFLFSLFSKGMGVSLVAVLFLIDFFLGRKFTVNTVTEKIPFILLALLFGMTAISAQRAFGNINMEGIASFPFPQRIVFASYGFITYIQKIFYLGNLCPYYFYPITPGEAMPGSYYVYPVLVILLAAVTIYSLKKTKKIAFGIGFYTVTVFLVLQLLPVGKTIIADRYTYISSIGIFYLTGEGLNLLLNLNPKQLFKTVTASMFMLFVFFLSYQTVKQIDIWKDGISLQSSIIRNYPENEHAYNNRAFLYFDRGNIDSALIDLNYSLKLKPNDAKTWKNIGWIYYQQMFKDTLNAEPLLTKALANFNKSLELDSTDAETYSNRGNVYYYMGKGREAIDDLTKAIELKPYAGESYYNRGITLCYIGVRDAGCQDLRVAIDMGYSKASEAYMTLCK